MGRNHTPLEVLWEEQKRGSHRFIYGNGAPAPPAQILERGSGSRFLHLFIFADEAAQARHGQSEAVKRFESLYLPELVGREVVFTDYELISGKPTSEQWA